MKTAMLVLLAFGLAFASQIVNVGETLGGTSGSGAGVPPADDSECYNLYAQCLRNGCAAAGGTLSEQTQGCDGGNSAAFAKAVGECSTAQGECVMGTGSGYDTGSGSGGVVPVGTTSGSGASQPQGGLCPLGFALLLSLAAAYSFASD
jgi:hypothetical protein